MNFFKLSQWVCVPNRKFVKNLLWLRLSFGIRNPGMVAMVAIRNLVAIQGCESIRNPDRNPVHNRRSRTFQGCEIAIETLFATLFATLIATIEKKPGLRILEPSGCYSGLQPWSQPWPQPCSQPWNGGFDQGFDQGCDQGCDFYSKPLKLSGLEVSTRVAIRVAIPIATLNRNQVSNRNHSNLFRVSISKTWSQP